MSAERNAKFLRLWAGRYPDTAAELVKALRDAPDGGLTIYLRRCRADAVSARPTKPVAPQTTLQPPPDTSSETTDNAVPSSGALK